MFLKKIKNKYCDLSVKLYHSKFTSFISKAIGIYSLISLLHVGQAIADDDLSGVKTSMQGDFGKDSTFVGAMYLVEIVMAGVTYIKSKNMMALIGVVLLSIFVNWAMGKYVFAV